MDYYCTSKKEWVNVFINSTNSSALDDYQTQFIPGRMECSGSDGTCEERECPIQKLLSSIKGS